MSTGYEKNEFFFKVIFVFWGFEGENEKGTIHPSPLN